MLRHRYIFMFFSLFLTSVILSPDADAASNRGFDVNDVSILFPLDKTQRPLPFIRLASPDQGFDLIPLSVFDAVLQKSGEFGIKAFRGVQLKAAGDWNILGFRYDPCAPRGHGESTESCLRELRLIAQPYEDDVGPADTALHLIYRLGEGEPDPMDEVVLALRQLQLKAEALLGSSNAGQPLGVHPLLQLAAQQGRQDVPQLFKDFLRRYALPSRLTKVTMMGLGGGRATDWLFFGGDIENGQWVHKSVPNMPEATPSYAQLDVRRGSRSFFPEPVNQALSTEFFFNNDAKNVENEILRLSHAIHLIENPEFSNRTITDCVSCHTTSTMRLTGKFKFLDHISGVTAKVPQGITAFPAPQILPNHPLHWNLRAFGYFGSDPAVSMRAVIESGNVAHKLNSLLNLSAPGPDCLSAEREVMNCFINSSVPFAKKVTTAECLRRCVFAK